MPLNAQILLSIIAQETSAGDLSRSVRVTPAAYGVSLSDGTGANQAQLAWSGAGSLSTQATSLNLRSLSDDRGTVTFSAIKAVYIKNSGSASVSWSGGTWDSGPLSAPASGGVSIPPGGAVSMLAPADAGYAVPSGSQTIELTSSSSSQYEIILIGEGTVA